MTGRPYGTALPVIAVHASATLAASQRKQPVDSAVCRSRLLMYSLRHGAERCCKA